jgi:hypothetical protein
LTSSPCDSLRLSLSLQSFALLTYLQYAPSAHSFASRYARLSQRSMSLTYHRNYPMDGPYI